MVMEMMMGGELFDYVVEKGTLSEEEASVIVRKVTSAVAHMHGLDIIHRDLKPENLVSISFFETFFLCNQYLPLPFIFHTFYIAHLTSCFH
jgi:serine/threonine protein kinase